MTKLNALKIGIGSLVCASVLTACADGRGTNGFKSFRVSDQEIAANLAAKKAQEAEEANKNNATDDSSEAQSATGEADPKAIVEGTDQNPPLFTPIQDESAKQKMLTEQTLSPDADQQVAAPVQDLNVTIESEIKRGPNPAATGLIKGITVTPSGDASARVISIQAIVTIGGEDLYMDASQVPVKFQKDGQVPNMFFRLMKPCDQTAVAAKNLLWAAAKCKDEACNQIELVLSFEVTGGRANGVMILEPSKTTQGLWAITQSNLKTLKLFKDAQADGAKCDVVQDQSAQKPVDDQAAAQPVIKMGESKGGPARYKYDAAAAAKAKADGEKIAADRLAAAKKPVIKDERQRYFAAKAAAAEKASAANIDAKPVIKDARQRYFAAKAAAAAKASAANSDAKPVIKDKESDRR